MDITTVDEKNRWRLATPGHAGWERTAQRRMPPRLGEHTDEVLRAASYSDAKIASLKADNVIA
jgi:crotonobetainyl-CoA:carnitine CoA-transferase CaiB-like acyl-CoA transferase